MKELFIFLLMLLSLGTLQAETNPIVPKPLSFTSLKGEFLLFETTSYQSDTLLSGNGLAYLQQQLKCNSDYILPNSDKQVSNTLFYRQDTSLKDGAYRLQVNSDKVILTAGSQSGFFYATVSLMQLMPARIWGQSKTEQPKKLWSIPACRIKDAPRFKWRGMMLDSSRNFFSKAYVKKFIDRMAQHKLNIFHWHLTDDEGWRIEIKKYPLLTEVGSKRGPGTQLPFSLYPTIRGPKDKTQSGYYSQDDIKEIVAYAAKRSVNILPEIDIPGHAKAAVIAYPSLLQDSNDKSLYTSVQKVRNNTVDPGLKSTYTFLDNVIKEVVSLFPFEYIHLGGDEVPKGAWQRSPSVKRLMQTKHLKNNAEVEAYFFSKMEMILKSYKRKMIGWQEIRTNNHALGNDTVIMAWRGDGAELKAAKNAHKVIISPAQKYYFDQQYVKDKDEYGHTWAGPTDTKEVYQYKPLHATLSSKERTNILGVHACLWSETALNEDTADYLVWPRALAFSERAWSGKKAQDWSEFSQRITTFALPRLQEQNINFRPFPH